ncbi:MAG: hypothetical protein JW928_09745 [Candidatus Aureabacteria bacterium]|nr:hypothetical protein [Candidatus Auribacterota bacterium]
MKRIIILLSAAFFLILSYFQQGFCSEKIIQTRGGTKVFAVQHENGDWELMVDGKPYFIKGVLFSPVKIGESPGDATMRDWMYYDDNNNSVNDMAYEVWVDKNRNNIQDEDEKPVGDFQILKDLGCNTIRLYHLPSDNALLGDIYRHDKSLQLQYDHAPNKELLRDLHKTYSIRVIMGTFLGSWTIGAGVPYKEGCDYTNKQQRENIKKSVQAMVEDHKDESYVLMWLLGNENNIATWSQCNARTHIREYYQLVNEIAKMVHEMDPLHPVAVCEGYIPGDLLLYKKYLTDIDIVAYNAYMGDAGFHDLWDETKKLFDRPVFISEYGLFSYNTIDGVNEEQQLDYHRGCYIDMMINRAGGKSPVFGKGAGNCIGGVIFDYLDRWYMDGQPSVQNPGNKYWSHSKDHKDHEEYFGITSMGDGKHNYFKRQLKCAYDFYQKQWTGKAVSSNE